MCIRDSDVVKYKGRVVGACSPDSFLFTSASYKLDEKAPFLSSGRFTDPLKAELDPARLNLLFGYVQHLRDHITAFADHLSLIHISEPTRPY